MAFVTLNCPHCGTNKVQFLSKGEAVIEPGREWVLLQCNNCLNSVISLIEHDVRHSTPQSTERKLGDAYIIRNTYPKMRSCEPPDDTPENISNFYRQGVSSINAENYDAAGSMFRKAVDVATKKIGGTSSKLVHRIDELSKKHFITEEMAKWAHEIRLSGNDAAHDEECFTKGQCEELLAFTELFLMYCFTLPAKMVRQKAARSS